MKSKNKLLNRSFSHIYIEKEAQNYEVTKNILKKFPNSQKVEINSYKEIFSRNNQDFNLQKKNQKLILAVKKDGYLYEGAKVCESFGNENFYYVSSVLNCIYDCEYCYLQGVYSSGNIVVFVNIETMFDEINEVLKEKDMYICISYDTDLLALEGSTGFIKRWYEFVKKNPKLKIELRTKSNNIKIFEELEPCESFIIAWTLSPEKFSKEHEKGTPSLSERLKGAKILLEKGWNIRICFDPIIKIENFKVEYRKLVEETFKKLNSEKIIDVSIGTFRISKEYLKRMRKNRENSLLLNYPFHCKEGVYTYLESEEMIDFMRKETLKYIEEKKLFI